MRHRLIEALVISAGVALMGNFIRLGMVQFKQMDRLVSVKGLAEMEVEADNVTWPIAYNLVGNDLGALYTEMLLKNTVIQEFLSKGGIPLEEVSTSAPSVVDMRADRYANQTSSYRYMLTPTLTVSTDKVDEVNALISKQAELMQQGIAIVAGDYRYSIVYDYTGFNEIKNQMIERSTKSARLSAEQFAKDSGSRLGKIRRASQGQFTISDINSTTPERKIIRVVSTIDYELKD